MNDREAKKPEVVSALLSNVWALALADYYLAMEGGAAYTPTGGLNQFNL